MIDLYSWQTPNGRKVSIMLEEIGIDYNVFPINYFSKKNLWKNLNITNLEKISRDLKKFENDFLILSVLSLTSSISDARS